MENYFVNFAKSFTKYTAKFNGRRELSMQTASILLSYRQFKAVISVSTEFYHIMGKSATVLLYT